MASEDLSIGHKMRIGIVGAGLIGTKRALCLSDDDTLVAVADLSFERAKQLALSRGATVEKSWEDMICRNDIDAIIVATSNDVIVPCAIRALQQGKHVLIEKPGARNPKELKTLLQVAEKSSAFLGVGLNHRFHPAFQKAKKMIEEGAIGPLMYIRARYGHGGRVGYDQEWRANPAISGGGELLDQGVHLIDLCRWLGGEFELEYGKAKTFFWNMPVDDNGFMLLKSPDGKRSAFLHASCTEWKNLFDFEIFGAHGKLQIWGLGRSYGVEELRYYKMKPEMGPPDVQIDAFPGEDFSWHREFEAFKQKVKGHPSDIGTVQDAYRTLEIVYDVYRSSGMSWIE